LSALIFDKEEMDNNAMNKKETTIVLKCDCGCSMLVVDKEEWDDGEVDYNISVQDSRYDHNHTTLWGRIKSAFWLPTNINPRPNSKRKSLNMPDQF
jgi:hypothetical protein